MKTPQLVMPRTTPPAERMMLPVVLVILGMPLGRTDGEKTLGGVLFDLVDTAAWADLRGISDNNYPNDHPSYHANEFV